MGRGDRRQGIQGNFEADLTTASLRSAKLKGNIRADAWDVGVVGEIRVYGGDFQVRDFLADSVKSFDVRYSISDVDRFRVGELGRFRLRGSLLDVAEFTADYIGSFRVGGDVIGTTVRLGLGSKGYSVKSLRVDGWLRDSTIIGEGDIVRARFGGMDGSVLAVDLAEDLSGLVTGASGIIRNVSITGRGIGEDEGAAMKNSLIAAYSIEKASLSSVQTDNTGHDGFADLLGAQKFGLASRQVPRSVRVRDHRAWRWSQVNMPDGTVWEDFCIRII